MRKFSFSIALLSVLVLCLQAAPAIGEGFITAKELGDIYKDDNVRIVSTRSTEDYEKVHIKGAIHVDCKALHQDGDIKGLLKSPEEIAEYLGGKGISEANTVVIYDSGKNNTSGRLYWILEYLGCADVYVLDGHMKQWRKARKPVTKKATEVEAATFTVKPNAGMLATIDDIRKGEALLVDVRSEAEYAGEKGEIERKGHIPGTINFSHTLLFTEDETLKPVAELEKLFTDAGISKDKDVLLFCETSVRAGVVYLVLDTVLEYPNVRVYDGGIFEWSADAANPIE